LPDSILISLIILKVVRKVSRVTRPAARISATVKSVWAISRGLLLRLVKISHVWLLIRTKPCAVETATSFSRSLSRKRN
jgi:hypothetical protein